MGFKSSGEALLEITFGQRYPAFLVGHSTKNVAFGTLLPRFSTLDICYWAETFGTCYELERDLNNARTKRLAEIRLGL